MSQKYLKIFIAFILIFIIGILVLDNVKTYQTQNYKKPISEYYEQIKDQENILAGEKISEEQIKELDICYSKTEKNFACFVEYYEKYNSKYTLQETFSNLSLLMREYPKYKDYCHQMAHGIGHAELEKNKGDFGKTLSDFSANKYFKNIRSCGSGYFHGLLEQAVKKIDKKVRGPSPVREKLVEYFKETCNNDEYKNILKGDCIHGLGHASFIQLSNNVLDAIYVCDNVTQNVNDKFNCYTGVFMQANLDLKQEEIILKNDTHFEFPMCDKIENELQKRACFFESVLQFKNFVGFFPTLPKGEGEMPRVSYADMIPLCKNFNNDLYRLVCIRNISIRSVSENAESNLQKMCIDNVNTKAERIMCVTGFAHKMAMSITNEERNENYFKITNEICNYLNSNESLKCKDIIKNEVSRTYIVEQKDLNLNK